MIPSLPLAFLLLSMMVQSGQADESCVPIREFVPFPGVPGMYHRVSPDGNYVIQSFSASEFGDVSIIDLHERDSTGKRKARVIRTPMNNETYAVEGSWRYVASPNHSFAGMKYFRFEDLLKSGENAKEFFSNNFSEFYHTCAELPGTTATRQFIRTLSWSKLTYVDLTVNLNADTSLQGEVKSTGSHWMCANLYTDEGFELVQPMLSKDGTEVAGIPQNASTPTMRVYRITGEETCEKVLDLGFQTGKVSFSHPVPGKKGMLAFTTDRGTYVFDRDAGVTFPIDEEPGGSYPNFTRDGRVVYLTNQNGSPGYMIVDPFQSFPHGAKRCITKSEVAEVERNSSALWKTSP